MYRSIVRVGVTTQFGQQSACIAQGQVPARSRQEQKIRQAVTYHSVLQALAAAICRQAALRIFANRIKKTLSPSQALLRLNRHHVDLTEINCSESPQETRQERSWRT